MISLVKYKIKDASNIVIDTETFIKQVDDDIISLFKYKIKWVSNIAFDTETCDWAGRYMIRPLRSSYG